MSLFHIFRAFLCLHSQFRLFEYLTACQLKDLLCCIPKWMFYFCPYRSGKEQKNLQEFIPKLKLGSHVCISTTLKVAS